MHSKIATRFGSKFNNSFLAIVLLSGCSTDPRQVNDKAPTNVPIDISSIPDAVPRYEPYSKSANPKSYIVLGKKYHVLRSSKGYRKQGIASWYGKKFHGKKTSNGETYNMYAMTAAHKTLPIPSYVKVTNLKNQRSVIVRINDRGPFHNGRIIDLSYTAAIKLDIQREGTEFVEVRTITPGQNLSNSADQIKPKEKIYLQVGAFNNEANAVKLKNKILALHSINYRIQTTNRHNQTIYKLLLGPILSVAQADEMNLQLAQLGITNPLFITEKK
jgi:rare lipoprotein A